MAKLELILPYMMTTVVLLIVAAIIFRLFLFILQRQQMKSGPIDEQTVKFLEVGNRFKSDSLKWGLLLLFGGAGLILIQFLPFDIDRSPLPYGVEAIFLAAGFISYAVISNKINH